MNNLWKRSLSFVMALVMVFTMLPVNVLAEELNGTEPTEHTHAHEAVVTAEATCTEDGVRTYTCSCGDSYTEAIGATGHAYENGVCACGAAEPTEAPATEAPTEEETKATEHTHAHEAVVTTEATCMEDGVRTYTCSCGDTYTEAISATGHTFVEGICGCGETEPSEEPTEEETEAPKAELSGETRRIYYYNVEGWDEVWAAWSFDEENFEDVAFPGVEMNGNTELENVWYVTMPVEADEILFNDGVEVTAALLEQERLAGLTVTHEIEVRLEGDKFYNFYREDGSWANYAKTVDALKATEETEAPTQHTHAYEGAQTKAPTCEEAGEMTYSCTCGESNTEVLPALGHSYEAGVCTNCGAADPVAEVEAMIAGLPTEVNSEDEYKATEKTLKEIDEIVESDEFPADAYQNLDWAKIAAAYDALDVYDEEQRKAVSLVLTEAADNCYWDGSTLYIKDGSITGANFIKAVQEKTGSTLSTVYYGTSDLRNPAGFRAAGTQIVSATTYTSFTDGTTYYASTYARSGFSVSGTVTGAFTVKHYYYPAITETGNPTSTKATVTEKVISGNNATVTLPAVPEELWETGKDWVAVVTTGTDSKSQIPDQTIVLNKTGTKTVTVGPINSVADATISVAYMKANSYTITVKTADETPWGTASTNATSSIAGETITVTATPTANSASANYDYSKLTVNGVEQTGLTFTMPEGNVEVVVYFNKDELKSTATNKVDYNGYYTSAAAEGYPSGLAAEIIEALGVQFAENNVEDEAAVFSIQFFPRYEGLNSDLAYWSDDSTISWVLDGKLLYDLNAGVGTAELYGAGFDGKNFGERGYNGGNAFTDTTEKVRITHEATGLYIDTYVTLTESRDAYVVQYTDPTVTFENQSDIDTAVKNALTAANSGCGTITATMAENQTLPTAGNTATLTYNVTVAANENYLGTTTTVDITAAAKSNPAQVNITINGNGTVKLGALEASGTLSAGTFNLIATPGLNGYVSGVTMSVSTQNSSDVVNGTYTNCVFTSEDITIENDKTYNITVNFGVRTLNVQDVSFKVNGYSTDTKRASYAANVTAANVAKGSTQGTTVVTDFSKFTVELWVNKGLTEEYVTVDEMWDNHLDLSGNRRIRITWAGDNRYPTVVSESAYAKPAGEEREKLDLTAGTYDSNKKAVAYHVDYTAAENQAVVNSVALSLVGGRDNVTATPTYTYKVDGTGEFADTFTIPDDHTDHNVTVKITYPATADYLETSVEVVVPANYWDNENPGYVTPDIDDDYEDHFDVVYDVNGAKTTHEDILVGKATPAAPTNPTKTYYTFAGWSPTLAEKVEADDATNGVITYTATWTPVTDNNKNNVADEEETYTVVYMDGETELSKTENVAWGAATPAAPNATKENFNLAGWSPARAATVTAPAGGNTITYVAQWTELFAVEFVDRDNQYGQVQSVADGDYATEPAAPTWDDDHDFLGWYNGDEEYVFTTPVTSNLTLIAKWQDDFNHNNEDDAGEPKYTVTYIVDNETVKSESVLVGLATPTVGTPSKTGSVFNGWSPEVSATVTANVTYTAQWKPDANGNGVNDETETSYVQVNVTGNGTVTLSNADATVTSVEGETGKTCKYKVLFNSKVNGANVLTVTATPKDTIATDGSVDYLVSAPGTVTVTAGQTSTVNAQFATNAIIVAENGEVSLNGYYKGTAAVANAAKKLAGLKDKVLTAAFGAGNYNANEYTVYMIVGTLNGGTENVNVDNGGTDQINMASRFNVGDTNQTFIVQKNANGNVPAVSDTISIKPVESRQVPTVTFGNLDAETYNTVDDFKDAVRRAITVKSGDTVVSDWTAHFTQITDSTSHFAYTVSVEVTKDGESWITGTLTETKDYTAGLTHYTVTWDPANGKAVTTTSVGYGIVPTAPATDPVKANTAQYTYAFLNWGTLSAVTGDVTYTAQYSATVNQYTVIWNNWDNTELAKATVDYGTVPVYPNGNPTRDEDYVFSGWSNNGNVAADGSITGNVTFTATFTKDTIVELRFWDGGDAPLYTQYVNVTDGDVTAAYSIQDKEDLIFGGWYTDATYETAYVFGNTITEADDVYAKWIADTNDNNVLDENETVTVTIVGNGTVTINGTQYNNGDSYVYNTNDNSNTIVATPADVDGSNAAAGYVASVKLGSQEISGAYSEYIWTGTTALVNGQLTVTFGNHEIVDAGSKIVVIDGYSVDTILDDMTKDAVLKAILGTDNFNAEEYDVTMKVNITVLGKTYNGYYDVWDLATAFGGLASLAEEQIKELIDIPGTENFKVVWTAADTNKYPVVTEYFDVSLQESRPSATITAEKTELTVQEFDTAEEIMAEVQKIKFTAAIGETDLTDQIQIEAVDEVELNIDGQKQTLKYRVYVEGAETYAGAEVTVTVTAYGKVHPAIVTVKNETTMGAITDIAGEHNANVDNVVEFSVDPAEGYYVESVTVNDTKVDGIFSDTIFTGSFQIANGDHDGKAVVESKYEVVVTYGKRELVLKETIGSVYYNNGTYSKQVFCNAVIASGAADINEYTINPETITRTGEFNQEFTIVWNGTEQYPEIKVTVTVPMTDKSLAANQAEFESGSLDTQDKVNAFVDAEARAYLVEYKVIAADENVESIVVNSAPTPEELAALKQGEFLNAELTVTTDKQSMGVTVPVTAAVMKAAVNTVVGSGEGEMAAGTETFEDITVDGEVQRYEVYTVTLVPGENHFIDTLTVIWDASIGNVLTDLTSPVALAAEDGVLNLTHEDFDVNGQLTLYLLNGYGMDQGTTPSYNITATFIDPKIEITGGVTVDYFPGETTVDEIDSNIIAKVNPVTTPENLFEIDGYTDENGNWVEGTVVEYLARPAGKYSFKMNVDFMGIGEQEIEVDLPDLWLKIDEKYNEFAVPTLDSKRITQILDALDIDFADININDPSSVLGDLTLEQLQQFPEFQYLGNAGAHEFGKGEESATTQMKQEYIRIISTSQRFSEVNSGSAIIFLNDERAKTEIKLTGVVPTVTYGNIDANAVMAQILDGVYANGEKITATVRFATDITKLSASDEVQTIELVFDGDKHNQDCTATAQIKVNRATATVSVDSRLFQHPNNLPNVSDGKTGLESIVTTNPAGVSTIQFIVGLDISNTNLNGVTINGIMGTVQLMLPEDLQEMLNMVSKSTGVNFSDGAEMTISELQESLDVLGEYVIQFVPEYEEMVNVLMNMISKLPTEVADLKIKIGGSMPTNIGAYLVGAVTADNNYETAYNAGIVVIAPNGKRADIDWVYHDDNYIFTNTYLHNEEISLSAQVVKVYEGDAAEAEANIVELFLGIDVDGTITLTRDQKELDVGAYVEVAMIVDMGNEMYYSEPIARPIVVVAETLDVDFVDDSGNVNNERHYEFFNVPHNEMEGNLKITYKQGDKAGQIFDKDYTVTYVYAGVQTNGMPYASKTAPTHAGAYTITAIVVSRDGNMVTHAGQGIGALVIEPSKSTTTVENEAIKWTGAEHKVNQFVTSSSVNVPGLQPDTTVISAGIHADLNADIGLDAIKGNVNVDLPNWMDNLLKKLNILEAAYTETGITAEVFLSYVEKLEAEITKLGVETDAFAKIVDVIKQLPGKTTLTFQDDKGYSEVGVYLVIGIVTDSDHYPSADAGVMIIYPDATKVELRFNETWDGNNVFSQAYLEKYDLSAQAYNLGAPVDAEPMVMDHGKVVDLFVGFADHGELEFTSNKLELDNGIYAQVSFVWDLSNNPYYAEPISREVIIVPNNAKIDFVDEDGNVNNERHFQFVNKPHSMNDIRVTLVDGTVLDLTAEDSRVAIYYLGVQTNGMPYAGYDAPIHAGAYEVTAQYTERDAQDRVIHLGVGIGAMVIEPSKSETTVDNAAYPYGGEHHVGDLVHASSVNVPGLIPDTTVISAGLSADLSNITGLDAINGTVNIDLPEWFDKVMTKLNVLEAGYADGISAEVFLSYADKIREGLVKLDVDTASFDEIISFVEQLPITTNLTFKDNIGYTEVGAYLVVAVVTDSDHYPSVGAGVMVIHPNVTKVDLEFEEDWNNNRIFTWYALQNMNLEAKAYLNGAYCKPADEKVVNLYFGFADNGKFLLDAVTYGQSIKDVPEFRNGVYTQLALVQDLGNEMYYAKPISRTFVIVPTPAIIEFVDDKGNVNADRHFVFNNKPQGMDVRVTIVGEEQTDLTGLTVNYVGVQTNGQHYNSTVAPTHSGAYAVTATYTARDELGRLVTLGAAAGAMVIEPAKSTIDVKSKLHEYNREAVSTEELILTGSVVPGIAPDKTVITTSISTDGTFSENLLNSITSEVNIDFPEWADKILTKYAPSIYNGMKAGEFADKVMNKLNDVAADAEALADEYNIPADKLINAMDAALAEVEEVVAQLPENVVLTFKNQADVAPTAVGTYLIIGIVTDSNHYPSADVGVLVIYPKVTKAKLDWVYKDSNGIFTLPALKTIDLTAIGIVDAAEDEDITAMIDYLTVGIDVNGKLIVTTEPNNVTSNGAYTEVAYIPTEVGAEMTVAAPILRSFVVVPQTVDVEVTDTVAVVGETYEVPVTVTKHDGSAVKNDHLKLTYVGVNMAAGLYHSTEKPTNAGIYAVIATYVERDGRSEYAYVGMNVGKLTIVPAGATVDVKSRIHEFNNAKFNVMDLITSDPDDAKLAVITSALNLDGDFSKSGILATGTSVNIDFPARADEVIKKILPAAYTDGIELNPFFQKLDDISAELVEVGFDADAVAYLKKQLEQLPSNTKLTFKEQSEVNPSAVGVYLITAVVMDPDYVPAVDAGLLVITADVDLATLKWNYRDSNNIITREVIAEMDMAASAYVKDALDAAMTERISYVVMGVGSNGSVTLTDDPAQIKNLPNGVYTEIAYICQQVDAEMTVAIPILRTFAIVNHSVDVNFEDICVPYDGERHPVEVTLNGTPAGDSEHLTVTYINLGRGYYSTVAPSKIGSYTVIAKYEEIVNGDTAAFGMEIGNVTITPATSKIDVTGDTVTYDGKAHGATVVVNGGDGNADYILISGGAYVRKDLNEIGVDAFCGNVNIDFPAWLDKALADCEFKTEGIDTAYLIDFIDSHRNNLVAMGLFHEKINAAIDELLSVLNRMPKNVSLTFEDNVTYTEPGYYFYYGMVMDPNHYPSSDTGLLIIEKKDLKFGAWHEVVPYDGKEHTVFVPNDLISIEEAPTVDYITLIADRKNNHVNIILDDDMMHVLESVERILGVEIPNETTIEGLRAKLKTVGLDVDDFANALIHVIDAVLAEMKVPETPKEYAKSTYRDLENIKKILAELPNEGIITINGKRPVNVGAYEFYIFGYSQYYKSVDASAVLFIEPIRVVVNDNANSKVYGDTDPELTAEVKYYSIVGREDPYTWKDKTDGQYGKDYSAYDDGNFYRIVYKTVEITTLPEDIQLTYQVVREDGEDVGTYAMSVENASIADSENYILEVVEDDTVFTITKEENNSWTEEPSIEDWTYGETPNAPTGEAKYGQVKVEYRPANGTDADFTETVPTEAGDYVVRFTVEGTDNYNGITIEKELTIAKAESEITEEPEAVTGLVYNGEDQELIEAGSAEGGKLVYSLTGEEGSFSEEIPVGKDAGTYTVYYKVLGDKNHNDSEVKSITVTVAKANDNDWTVAPGIEGWTYGETAKEPTGEAKYGQVKVEYRPANGTDADFTETVPTEAGDYVVRFTVEDTDNYNGITIEKELTIAKAESEITEEPEAVTGLVYNGEDQELIEAGSAEGGKLVYSLTGEEGSFSEEIPVGKDAGTYTVYYKVLGDENHNDSEVKSFTVTVAKAIPEVEAPTGLTATAGQTLADVELPEGFTWADDSTTSVGAVGENEFWVIYTPADTDNYEPVRVKVTITVTDSHEGQYPIPFNPGNDKTGTIAPGSTVDIDGIPYVLDENGIAWVENTDAKIVTTYKYHEGATANETYPTNMYVWYLTAVDKDADGEMDEYSAERIPELDDLFQYNGTSIRVGDAKNGIRFFTSIASGVRPELENGTLISNGILKNAKMVRAGTVFKKNPTVKVTLDNGVSSDVYGGKAGSDFRVFGVANNRDWFTGMLVGLETDADTIKAGIAARPYAELEVNGSMVTIYGGQIERSIYYVAKQNQNTFAAGSAFDDFVEGLITKGES